MILDDPENRIFAPLVVWIPMLDGDELPEAVEQAARFHDVGVPQFWDGAQMLGNAVAASLGAPGWTAWDIYLFYPPDATWTSAALPAPEAVLIQAGGVVVGAPGTLPPLADQSRLPARLRGRAIVVGEQANLEDLLARVARARRAETTRGGNG